MTTATNARDVRLAAEGISVLQARSETTDAGPRLEIVAYTGGLMTVPGWGAVAVALDGLDIAGQVPLLADHDAFCEARARVFAEYGQTAPRGDRPVVVSDRLARDSVHKTATGVPWLTVTSPTRLRQGIAPAEKVAP